MKSIYAKFKLNGKSYEYTFRTNNSGNYLFVGTSENHQISCESGFSLPRLLVKQTRAVSVNTCTWAKCFIFYL